MVFRARATSLLLFGFTALSCSSGSSDSSGNAGGFEGFTQQFAARYCELAAGCCQQAGTTPNSASCRASIELVLLEDARSLTSGRGTFDAEAAAECLDALTSFFSGCSPPGEKPLVCERVVSGNVAPGGTCGWNTDCQAPEGGQSYCKIETFEEPLEGICVATAASTPGSPCAALSECDDNPTLYCAVGEGVCKPLLAQGEPCSPDAPCGEGLVCRLDGSTTYVCAEPLALGSDCSPGDCVEGAYCASGKCAPQKQAGEACSDIFYECVSACDPAAGVCEPFEPPNVSCFAD